ncbi:MAG: Gfo/Idh/MocA family protein [Candidatus Helarchaeota archaeon]
MNIGIIGCGTIASTHIETILNLINNANLFLCDINKSQAKKLLYKFQANKIYTSIDKLLSKETLDTVHVLTPVSSHFEIAKKALFAGCHVYIEKPVARKVGEFKNLCDLAKKQRRIIGVGYSALGMPVVIKARKEIDSGMLGRLIAVHCDFMCSENGGIIPYGDPNHWSYNMEGGILQNMADHPASLIVDVLDEIKEHEIVFSRRNLLPNDCIDLLHVAIRNEAQVGSFTLSIGHGNVHREVKYFLEGGTIIVDMSRQLISIIKNKGPQNFINKTLTGVNVGWDFTSQSVLNVFKVIKGSLKRNPGIINLIRNFYSAIWAQEELIVNYNTVKKVVSILEDVWKKTNP